MMMTELERKVLAVLAATPPTRVAHDMLNECDPTAASRIGDAILESVLQAEVDRGGFSNATLAVGLARVFLALNESEADATSLALIVSKTTVGLAQSRETIRQPAAPKPEGARH